jgi:uncharacterized protein (DUF305 family)
MIMLGSTLRRRGPAGWRSGTPLAVLAVMIAIVPAAQAKGPAGAYDRAFLTEMVGHHAMAVEMGRMAEEKATHPKLKRAGETIVRTQSAEIRRMRRWLREWYGKRVEPMVNHEDMMEMEELEAASGAEFEVRFMVMMSVHHAQAIERATVALKRARHPKVRRLARAIVQAQEREIGQFSDWLVTWYAN